MFGVADEQSRRRKLLNSSEPNGGTVSGESERRDHIVVGDELKTPESSGLPSITDEC